MMQLPYYTPEGLLRVELKLVTEEELAAAIGVQVVTLRSWRGELFGPRWTKLGKNVFYRLQDVQEWIDQNVVKPEVVQCE